MDMTYLIQMIHFIKIYAQDILQLMELMLYYQIEENTFLMIHKLHAKKIANIHNILLKHNN